WQVVSQFGVEVLSLSTAAAAAAAVLLVVAGSAIASAFSITPSSGNMPGTGGPVTSGGSLPIVTGGPGGLFQSASTPSANLGHGLPMASTPPPLLVLLGISIALGVLASVTPAWSVARIRPAQVLRAG